jgi:hypothetical protein
MPFTFHETIFMSVLYTRPASPADPKEVALRFVRPSLTTSFCSSGSSAALAVILFVDVAEMGVGDVGVDLGGVDGGVAEQLLDGADVGAI